MAPKLVLARMHAELGRRKERSRRYEPHTAGFAIGHEFIRGGRESAVLSRARGPQGARAGATSFRKGTAHDRPKAHSQKSTDCGYPLPDVGQYICRDVPLSDR